MKIRTILPFALILALLTGCAEDEATTLNVSGEPMAFCIAQDAQTRAVNLTGDDWEGGEEVAVSVGDVVKKYVVDATDHSKLSPASGVTPFIWTSKTETKTVTAWYPYAATKPATVTVPADQSTEAKLRAAIMLEATVSGVTYGTTAALPFTHRTAKVTIRPLDTGDGNAMHATATVSLTNLAGVSSGTTVTPLRNADNSFTAIIAPQTIAATTAFASIGYSGSTWAYKPGATTLAAASAYTFNVSYESDPYTGHTYVDMGNGLKWATCNVGATTPEDYGDYFDWGATAPYYQTGHSQESPCTHWIDGKDGYNWKNYSFMENGQSSWKRITKYTFADNQKNGTKWYDGDTFIGDGKTSFADDGYVDDAARANWGGNWRTPTDAEWTWLRDDNNCTWTWTTQNGVNGMLVTSKVNGNKIFLPAAGFRSYASLYGAGSYGYYWSSSLIESISNCASYVDFGSGGVGRNGVNRYCGQSVRPVSN